LLFARATLLHNNKTLKNATDFIGSK
jgi:hypothetical protein